jgi:cell division protein FtsB
MAVYQGARRRTILDSPLIPRPSGRRETAEAPPRRRLRGAVRAKRQSNRMGFLLGGIVLAFMLAFFSLAQTVTVSATSYDIDRLTRERERLEAQIAELRQDLGRLGSEPAIRKLSIDAGLGQLAEPVVLP